MKWKFLYSYDVNLKCIDFDSLRIINAFEQKSFTFSLLKKFQLPGKFFRNLLTIDSWKKSSLYDQVLMKVLLYTITRFEPFFRKCKHILEKKLERKEKEKSHFTLATPLKEYKKEKGSRRHD